ncbi:MAG: hypothetical protein IPP01_05920 [Saprospiraceae bacterium]|nr:hypothetical protein [Saprospiraceae bacterium]
MNHKITMTTVKIVITIAVLSVHVLVVTLLLILNLALKTSSDSTIFVQVSRDDNTFLYYDSPSSTFLNTIWQPPKVNA